MMRFCEGQCSDINCHARTLTKSLRRSLEAAIKEKRKACAEEVKTARNQHDESHRPSVQEKVYGQCPKCKQMRFWENQCYDVNCHAGTLIKRFNQRQADAAKEENKTHANKWQAQTTPGS